MDERKSDKLPIRLHVYDMEMPVYVEREEERYYRDAADLITERMNAYASIYKGRKSERELYYMTLIDIALRYEKEASRNDTKPYSDILKRLTSEIEEAIKPERQE